MSRPSRCWPRSSLSSHQIPRRCCWALSAWTRRRFGAVWMRSRPAAESPATFTTSSEVSGSGRLRAGSNRDVCQLMVEKSQRPTPGSPKRALLPALRAAPWCRTGVATPAITQAPGDVVPAHIITPGTRQRETHHAATGRARPGVHRDDRVKGHPRRVRRSGGARGHGGTARVFAQLFRAARATHGRGSRNGHEENRGARGRRPSDPGGDRPGRRSRGRAAAALGGIPGT
jgi:hypothetical protein